MTAGGTICLYANFYQKTNWRDYKLSETTENPKSRARAAAGTAAHVDERARRDNGAPTP